MRTKKIYLLIFLLSCFFSMQVSALEKKDITCSISFINQEEPIVLNENLYFENNRILIPMRNIFELLGATVQWNKENLSITATKYDNTIINMKVQEKNAQIITTSGTKNIKLDSSPTILNGSTLVPLRFISETFGCEVTWKPEIKTVYIDVPYSTLEKNNVTYWFDGNTTGNLYSQTSLGVSKISTLDVQSSSSKAPCSYRLIDVHEGYKNEFLVIIEGIYSDSPEESNNDFLDHYYISNKTHEKLTTTIDPYYILGSEELDVNKIQYFQSDNIWLPGDNTVIQIDRNSGSILNQYILSDFTNSNSTKGHYYIWSNGTYLLIRVRADFKDSGSKTMYPVLINLGTQETIWLHKLLVPATELAFYEAKESSDQNLLLIFEGEQDGKLNFTYIALDGTESSCSYSLNP